jgi:exodeoxyribonuclease (lambda-induced)
MQYHNVEQKSPEWFELRLKYPLTASKADAIGTGGKGLETLCWETMAQKYSSQEKERYSNEHLERGVELEPQAISLYELKTDNKVESIGFVTNDNVSKVGGASPDGLVNDDGLIEVKCFDDTKHFKATIDFKKTGKFDVEKMYLWQMQMQMLFTERKWCDFVAYNPNYSTSLLIQRVSPDLEMQNLIKDGLAKGEIIINEIIKNESN